MEIRIQKHGENLKALITVSFGNHLSSPLSEQQCKNRIFGHAKPDNSEKIWHGWCLWQFAWLSQQRKLSTGTAQFSKYQQLSACWESDCCLCHSAKMFGESNPLAKLCKKNYMISYDINQTGWTKRLLILLDGNIGMKPPMYSTHQHGAQKWVYCDAKPRTFFGISVSHKTFHHVNSNFELLDIMTKCLDQSPSWQVFDQKTIRTNCIRHQCVNHSGFTELKNFSGTTKFNDYDRRIQTTIRRKHR